MKKSVLKALQQSHNMQVIYDDLADGKFSRIDMTQFVITGKQYKLVCLRSDDQRTITLYKRQFIFWRDTGIKVSIEVYSAIVQNIIIREL